MPTTQDVRYSSAMLTSVALDESVTDRLATYEKYGGRIHCANLSEQGRLTALLQLYGGEEAAEEIERSIERHPRDVSYEVDVDDDIRLCMNFEPINWTRDLHEAFRRHDIVVDWPIEPSKRGLSFTIVGREGAIKETLRELDTKWPLTIERFGTYDFEPGSRTADLTDRQREILRRAIAEGYYEVPRRVSQQELAAGFDVATGTMSEHLRKIEATVFGSMMD